MWLFSGFLAAVGIGLALIVFDWRAPVEQPAPLILVLLLFLAIEALRVDIEVGAHSHAITMCEVGLVVGVLTARPIDVILAQLVAVGIVFGLPRRIALVKLAFNIALVLTVTALGVIVMRGVGIGDAISERVAVAGLLAGFVSGTSNVVALAMVSRIAGYRHDRRELARELAYSIAGSVASAAIGLQMVLLGRESGWLVGLAAVPVGLMYVAFRSYAGQRRAAERSEFLHHAAIALHDSSNLDEGLLAMLEHTRTAVRAEFARVLLFTPDGALSVMAHHDPDRRLAMGATSAEAASAAQLLMHGLHRAALLDGSDPAARALLSALAVGDGIGVPLHRNGEQAGLLIAGNRLGDFDEFRRDDVRLVELVANQIGVALEKGWLEQSLQQLVELETRLQHQANHDGLTGVANRRLFNDRVDALFERRDHPGAALILVDLDEFKSVNDTHGHLVGDELLSVVAERLHTGVRSGDLVARIGGDEFAILLSGVDGPATALQRAAAIVHAVRQPVIVQGRMIVVRTSLGVALADASARTPGDLLRNADAALYRAKALGKNGYVLFESTMHSEVDRRRRLGQRVGEAIGSHLYQLRYQPIHDLVSGEVVAVEALVHWEDPEFGVVPPKQFVSLAQEGGMIVELGERLLEEAVRTVSGVIGALAADRTLLVHIDVTGPQIAHPGLISHIDSVLRRHGLPPDRLVLQASEAACLADTDQTRTTVLALRQLGVQLALDDFGVGYSALSHVHEMHFDRLMIDHSLTRSIGIDDRSNALLGAIIHFANALELTAVADGIETPDQLAELRRRGCRFGQGPLMSAPVAADELSMLVLVPRPRPAWVA